ncbi:MAG: peptide chain release factor N(5)-glutamine methyltransferase [Clostridiaceae bacterium]|nr:peptide chain release factor N(5)-glutamine methyltransferase [Clostridiaceae bacterium]
MIGEPIDLLIRNSAAQLTQAGIENPLYEARLLLEAASGISLKEQLTQPDRQLNVRQVQVFAEYIKLRSKRTPFAYITGQTEFYGRTFQVNNCLIPRPETELLVDLVLDNRKCWFSGKPRILELCTGTGCLGITLYLELKTEFVDPTVLLTDISHRALATCKANIIQYCEADCQIEAIAADLFPKPHKPQQFDLIIANPPYVRSEDIGKLAADVFEYEPHLALDGGKDGLVFYRRIAKEIKPFLSETGNTVLLLEHGLGQRKAIKQIFAETNLDIEKTIEIDDYQKHDRILGFVLKSH